MANSALKRAALYLAALLAVGMGLEWGFAYILGLQAGKVPRQRRVKK
jgi:hypothetical protein